MTTHNYTETELATAGFNTWHLYQKCLEHGYTNPSATLLADNTIDVTIDEADDKPTVLANMEAAIIPTLSLDKSSLVIAPGTDTDTVTVTDSRGAGATGKIVRLHIPVGVYVKVDVDKVTLDALGQGTFTFGPLTGCLGEVRLPFRYYSGEADEAICTLKFGT